MIQYITNDSSPSEQTLAKIAFINNLNAEGLNATLYGVGEWPKNKCRFKNLKDFSIERNSIIISDGLQIESIFDLVNLNRYLYTHGRKKRLLSYLSFFINYLIFLCKFNWSFKTICYNPNKFQKSSSYFDIAIHDREYAKFDLQVLINKTAPIILNNTLFIFNDITQENRIEELVMKSPENHIVLAGAIIEPLYFKEKIIPLFKSKDKKIDVIGFQEDIKSNFGIERSMSSAATSAIMKEWISLLKE